MSGDPNDLMVAWAMPVDFPDIGARLAAYAHTKATVTTFRLVTKYNTQSACHDLPEEIISMIAEDVREIVFMEKMARWIAYSGYAEEPRFSVRIFTEDFGVRPYFIARGFFDSEDYYNGYYSYDFSRIRSVKAYLTLPVQNALIESDFGKDSCHFFSVESVLKPTTLTKDQRRQFMIAANTLGLGHHHANKDKPAIENKPSDTRDASEGIGLMELNDGDRNSASAHGDTSLSGGQEDSNADAESGDEEVWPQLMILGCGRFLGFE